MPIGFLYSIKGSQACYLCYDYYKTAKMEKRVLGVILTMLGVIGLVMGAIKFVAHSNSNYDMKAIAMYGILGLIFFFAGIGLIRTTRDLPNG